MPATSLMYRSRQRVFAQQANLFRQFWIVRHHGLPVTRCPQFLGRLEIEGSEMSPRADFVPLNGGAVGLGAISDDE